MYSRALLLFALLLVAIAAVTLALFPTPTARAQPIVAVKATGIRWLTIDRAGNLLANLSNLAPGDSFIGKWTVTNENNFDVRYAFATDSTNADGKNLAAQIQIEVRLYGNGCDAFDGALLYRGALASANFGDANDGGQLGDRVLRAQSNEMLCLRATLPLDTPNAFQGATTTATFIVSAEAIE
ncbi:MAG: hypothetical protein HY327_11995 [Chloroflexi bacterium]|nr:hypothetical protein [Chloroflexota bacterium]